MGISEKIFMGVVAAGTLAHLNPNMADKMAFRKTIETKELPELAINEAEAKKIPNVQQQIATLRSKYQNYPEKTTVFTIVGKDKNISLEVKTDPFRPETQEEQSKRGSSYQSNLGILKN